MDLAWKAKAKIEKALQAYQNVEGLLPGLVRLIGKRNDDLQQVGLLAELLNQRLEGFRKDLSKIKALIENIIRG